jgi:hypothetical protein
LDRDFPEYESIAVDRGHANIYSHNNEKTLVWENRAMVWLARCFLFSRKFDIIHVHSGIQWLKYYRLFNPKKKIIIHLHGSKIRGKWDQEPDVGIADQIIVSTPDLLEGSPEGTAYLPNPVDEELCMKVRFVLGSEPRLKAAFHVDRYASDMAWAYADRYDLPLHIFSRDATPLPHPEFLELMANHEYYINVERSKFLNVVASHSHYVDVKRDYPGFLHEDKVLKALSLTGLEALMLGCKVIDWTGLILNKFPDRHLSFNVASRLHEIYQSMEETTN